MFIYVSMLRVMHSMYTEETENVSSCIFEFLVGKYVCLHDGEWRIKHLHEQIVVPGSSPSSGISLVHTEKGHGIHSASKNKYQRSVRR